MQHNFYRRARRREYDRSRRAAMTPAARQQRKERRSANIIQRPPDHQHMQPNTRPPQCTNYMIEVDDPHVIEFMQNFHRGLSDLQNEFCGWYL